MCVRWLSAYDGWSTGLPGKGAKQGKKEGTETRGSHKRLLIRGQRVLAKCGAFDVAGNASPGPRVRARLRLFVRTLDPPEADMQRGTGAPLIETPEGAATPAI